MGKVWVALALGLPVAAVSRFAGGPEWLTLSAAVLALAPLAAWIAEATDQLSVRVGIGMGGFLNATFANAVELLITVLALRRGLVDLVKASITGSILCNTLLVIGLSAFIGGLRHGPQKFRPKAAGRHAAMMILAVSAMALPAVFARSVPSPHARQEVSVGVAILLLLTYGAYLFYSYFSPTARQAGAATPSPQQRARRWTVRRAVAVLAGSIVGAAGASELLVEAVEPVSRDVGLSPAFVGLVIVPILGNVAEQYSGITFARENRINLSLSVAANSSTQIAVFVAPLLVLVSLLFHPLDLIFPTIQLLMLFASTAIFAYISLDGETNWLEGVQLMALYLIAAVAFFFLPR
ncbi:MAG TPA: calcium/proton exchanger [Thermoanaerobaculia bacterium]|nr:calcium/proton exchanger [Thermoanaerobaculia bacterium]